MAAHPHGGEQVVDTEEGRVEDLVENQLKFLRSVYTDPIGNVLSSLTKTLHAEGQYDAAFVARNIKSSFDNNSSLIVNAVNPNDAFDDLDDAKKENDELYGKGDKTVMSHERVYGREDAERWIKDPMDGLDPKTQSASVSMIDIKPGMKKVDGKSQGRAAAKGKLGGARVLQYEYYYYPDEENAQKVYVRAIADKDASAKTDKASQPAQTPTQEKPKPAPAKASKTAPAPQQAAPAATTEPVKVRDEQKPPAETKPARATNEDIVEGQDPDPEGKSKDDETIWKRIRFFHNKITSTKNPDRTTIDYLKKMRAYYRGVDSQTGQAFKKYLSANDYKAMLIWCAESWHTFFSSAGWTPVFEARQFVLQELAANFSDDPKVASILEKEKGGDYDKAIEKSKGKGGGQGAILKFTKMKTDLANYLRDLLKRVPGDIEAKERKNVEFYIDEVSKLDYDSNQQVNDTFIVPFISDLARMPGKFNDDEKRLSSISKAIAGGDYEGAAQTLSQVSSSGVNAKSDQDPNAPKAEEKKPGDETKPGAGGGTGGGGRKHQETKPLPQAKKQTNVSSINFVSPFNGRQIENFPIFYTISQAIDHPSFLFETFQDFGVIPANWTEEDFTNPAASESVQNLYRNIKEATKKEVESKDGTFDQHYENALSWLEIIRTNHANNLRHTQGSAALDNDTIKWLMKKFPREMTQIIKYPDSVRKIMLLMQGSNFSTDSGGINEANAEAYERSRVADIVSQVYDTMGKEEIGPGGKPVAKKKDVGPVTLDSDPFEYYAQHRNEIENIDTFLPGSLTFENRLQHRIVNPPKADNPLAERYYQAEAYWSQVPTEVKRSWLAYQSQKKEGDQSALKLKEIQEDNPKLYQQIVGMGMQRAVTNAADPWEVYLRRKDDFARNQKATNALLPGSLYFSGNLVNVGPPPPDHPLAPVYEENMKKWQAMTEPEKQAFLKYQEANQLQLPAKAFPGRNTPQYNILMGGNTAQPAAQQATPQMTPKQPVGVTAA